MDDIAVRLREILIGIDSTECANDDGWWETSTGAEFGASKLSAVEALFSEQNAEITTLRAKLAQAEADAARVVEWLRGLHWTHRDREAATRFADVFERGAHKEPTP